MNARLWGLLQSIEKRLTGIENKLENVIRLEERVSNHEQVISRFGKRIDEGDNRIRRVEIWQAEQNPNIILSSIRSNRDNIEVVRGEVNTLKENSYVSNGRKDVFKEILKWVAGVLAAVVIYLTTKEL